MTTVFSSFFRAKPHAAPAHPLNTEFRTAQPDEEKGLARVDQFKTAQLSRSLTQATRLGEHNDLVPIVNDLVRVGFQPKKIVIKIDDASTSIHMAGAAIVEAYRTIILPEYRKYPIGEVGLLEMRINSFVDMINPGLVDITQAHEPQIAEYQLRSKHPQGVLSPGSPLADALWLQSELGMKLRLRGFTGPIACLLTADGANYGTLSEGITDVESIQRSRASIERGRKFEIRFQLQGFVPHNERANIDNFIAAVGLINEPSNPDRNEVMITYYDPNEVGERNKSVTNSATAQAKFLRRTLGP